MKTHYKIGGFLSMLLLTMNSSFAQQDAFTRDFEGVKKEMVAWDAVRGEWLANSMQAVINNKPVPDRNFPEDYTPSEMFQAMPTATQASVRQQIVSNSQNTSNDEATRNQWSRLNNFATRPNCSPQTGRTYGDPHLKSFDGSTFSFQTVGEFTLVKSASGHMNVQVRQKASGESVSLNSAVAMDVAGDRLCIYASDLPDANSATPVRLEGQALYIEDKAYFLPHGGTVTRTRRNYLVTWPTGERVEVDMTGSDFMNVTTQIYPCNDQYDGVLGDGDGDRSDDFRVPNSVTANSNWDFNVFGSTDPRTRDVEQQYLTYVARDFGNYWRINEATTLFDYPFGRNTASYTDYTFPRQHISVRDMNDDQRDRARRNCQAAGLMGAELNACIFDNGMLNIPPSTTPNIVRTPTPITSPVRKPTPNVNPNPPIPPTPRGKAPNREVPVDINNGNGGVPRGGDGSSKGDGTSGVTNTEKDPIINAPGKNPGTTGTTSGTTTPVKNPGTTAKPVTTDKPVDGPPIEPETPRKKKPFVTWSSGSSDNNGTTTPTRTEPTSTGSGSTSSPTRSSGGSTTAPTRSSGGGGTTTSPTRSSGGGGSTTSPTRSSGGGTSPSPSPTRSSGGGTSPSPSPSKSSGVSAPVRSGKGG